MSRTLRYVLIGIGVLIVLLIVVPFFIPVNQFKPTIEEKASAALGRKVQLGNLSLSLWRGALTAQDLSIGDDPKFSPTPFLTAKSISVGVEIMPLVFSKQLNVTDITIDEPQVMLLKKREWRLELFDDWRFRFHVSAGRGETRRGHDNTGFVFFHARYFSEKTGTAGWQDRRGHNDFAATNHVRSRERQGVRFFDELQVPHFCFRRPSRRRQLAARWQCWADG